MPKYSASDYYARGESGTLKNRLGITDDTLLNTAEAAHVATRTYELEQRPLEGSFDTARLQATHRYLFQDVYDWAGQFRTVDISKAGSQFAHHSHIKQNTDDLFASLAMEKNLRGLDADAFSDRAAFYLGEINAIHGFREGNGRTQRQFMRDVAREAGYVIDWDNVTKTDMVDAFRASFKGSRQKLATLIRTHLKPIDAEPSPPAPKPGRRRGSQPKTPQ